MKPDKTTAARSHRTILGRFALALPPLSGKVTSAHSLIDGAPVELIQNANGVVLKLPAAKTDETDRVIVLAMSQEH